MSEPDAEHDSGASHGYDSVEPQCIALKASDSRRCTNGTTYSPILCGTHKKVEDVRFAPEEWESTWYKCPHCGWQPATWGGPGDPPYCNSCGVEIPPEAPEWSERDE